MAILDRFREEKPSRLAERFTLDEDSVILSLYGVDIAYKTGQIIVLTDRLQ